MGQCLFLRWHNIAGIYTVMTWKTSMAIFASSSCIGVPSKLWLPDYRTLIASPVRWNSKLTPLKCCTKNRLNDHQRERLPMLLVWVQSGGNSAGTLIVLPSDFWNPTPIGYRPPYLLRIEQIQAFGSDQVDGPAHYTTASERFKVGRLLQAWISPRFWS